MKQDKVRFGIRSKLLLGIAVILAVLAIVGLIAIINLISIRTMFNSLMLATDVERNA